MFGDVEEHAFRAVELDLETADPVARLVHVMRAAQCFALLRELLDIVDADAEMMQAGIVEAFADLIGLEPQDRQIDGPVAQVIAVSERPVGLADLLEVERLLVELGHRIGILGGDGDVTQLGHIQLLHRHPRASGVQSLSPGLNRRRATQRWPWLPAFAELTESFGCIRNYSAASLISAGNGSAPGQARSAE